MPAGTAPPVQRRVGAKRQALAHGVTARHVSWEVTLRHTSTQPFSRAFGDATVAMAHIRSGLSGAALLRGLVTGRLPGHRPAGAPADETAVPTAAADWPRAAPTPDESTPPDAARYLATQTTKESS